MNTCSRVPSGGTVTKILPRTRNDAMSKWGCSVASFRVRGKIFVTVTRAVGSTPRRRSTQDGGHALAPAVGEKFAAANCRFSLTVSWARHHHLLPAGNLNGREPSMHTASPH